MEEHGKELSSIDFESLIGGPLNAVVKAQAQAAMTTVAFIKEVGFKKADTEFDEGDNTSTTDPIYVTFRYPKEVVPYQPAVDEIPAVTDDAGVVITALVPAKKAELAKYQDVELSVPILTILPIPYLRVEEVTIDFNAKINSMEYQRIDTKIKSKTSASWSGFLWGSAKLKTSFSYQKDTTSGSSVRRQYSLAIHVRAVQDELPGGMEKVLGILEDGITSKPIGTGDMKHPVDRP